MRFGKASFMLDWNGTGGAFIFDTIDGDPYNPAWGADLGRPLRRKVELAPGLWRRRYEQGLVVVNATPEPVTVYVHDAPKMIQGTDALILSTAETGAATVAAPRGAPGTRSSRLPRTPITAVDGPSLEADQSRARSRRRCA